MRTRRVFLSIAAQEDNLGDIEIRQVALEMAASGGAELTVYVGSMSRSYLAAFNLPAGVRTVRVPLQFGWQTARAVAFRQAHLMFSPGPYVLPRNPSGHVKAFAVLVAALAVRASGGRVVVAGRAIRGHGWLGRLEQRSLARVTSTFFVRDAVSSKVVGQSIDRAPDLALARSRPRARGDLAVISLRGDRPVDDAWIARVVNHLRENGLTPAFVTQVGRDDAQHQRLGDRCEVQVVDWGDRSHREQAARVHQALAQARVVISDRLHSAVFGMQHGVYPVALVAEGPPNASKIVATLTPLVSHGVLRHGQDLESDIWLPTEQATADLSREIISARGQLDELGRRVARDFHPASASKSDEEITA